jgi:putative membrane protein
MPAARLAAAGLQTSIQENLMQKTLRLHRVLTLSLAGALFATGSAQAQTAAQGTAPAATAAKPAAKLDRTDRKVLTELAQANLGEIASARLALAKASNPEVKAYAQRMIDEHTKAQAEVQALAQAKGVELPKEPGVKHKAKGAMLEALSGDIFDRTYVKQSGRRDHRVTHEYLKDNLDKIKDPDVKALAAKMRPIVEAHLLAADELIAKTARGATGTAGTPGNDTSTATGKEPTPMKK